MGDVYRVAIAHIPQSARWACAATKSIYKKLTPLVSTAQGLCAGWMGSSRSTACCNGINPSSRSFSSTCRYLISARSMQTRSIRASCVSPESRWVRKQVQCSSADKCARSAPAASLTDGLDEEGHLPVEGSPQGLALIRSINGRAGWRDGALAPPVRGLGSLPP